MAAPLACRSALLVSSLSVRLRVCSSCARWFSSSEPQGQEHADQRQTHFGFQSVSEEEKEHKVYEVFENVASTYDLMNDVMSGGVHRLWKDHFMKRLSPTAGTKLVDVAGGTGDIAFRFLQYIQNQSSYGQRADVGSEDFDIRMPREIEAQVYMDPAENQSDGSSSSSSEEEDEGQKKKSVGDVTSHVTVCDINQAMLDVGKQRADGQGITSGISWVQGNAESLPFQEASFDAYTIAFGIRNCTNVQQVINEAYRVLKPGGRFMCLEFSQVTNPLLRRKFGSPYLGKAQQLQEQRFPFLSVVYDSYSFNVIPVMGQVIARDWKSYQYLVESIRQFPDQEEFSDMIRSSGFRMVTYENLTFGVAAIHSGFKLRR